MITKSDRKMVDCIEKELSKLPQVMLETRHVLHGGLYSRTILIPEGICISGAEIIVPTIVTIDGAVEVSTGEGFETFTGYNVVAASKGRKQIFNAIEDTWVTMTFKTDAKTVEEAEEEFTTQASMLGSRREDAINITVITGE